MVENGENTGWNTDPNTQDSGLIERNCRKKPLTESLDIPSNAKVQSVSRFPFPSLELSLSFSFFLFPYFLSSLSLFWVFFTADTNGKIRVSNYQILNYFSVLKKYIYIYIELFSLFF